MDSGVWDLTPCTLVFPDVFFKDRNVFNNQAVQKLLRPTRQRHYDFSKRREQFTKRHSVISQMASVFSSADVRTSNYAFLADAWALIVLKCTVLWLE